MTGTTNRRAPVGGPPAVLRPDEREAFKRCRREWDFGAREREGYEAAHGEQGVDSGRALKDALAVYYFPGMWEWDRSIVKPLARDAFLRSTDDEDRMVRGINLLDRYFDWASVVDDFVPVRIEADFEATVPDPTSPERDLTTTTGSPVRYRGRIDLLALDARDNYWIVDHRIGAGPWAVLDDLLLDERATAAAWAWERFFLGMRIAGIAYNEVRTDAERDADDEPGPAPSAAGAGRAGHRRMDARGSAPPTEIVVHELPGVFRRTRIPLSQDRLRGVGRQLADEALAMFDPEVRVYPSPWPAHCSRCDYREPCLATTLGTGPEEVLARSYRRKDPEQVVEGRLGGVTWSMGRGAAPPRFDG